jgi:hypothetical protein
MDQDRIVIDSRFCGPPNSGNGGYVCGRVAEFIDGPAVIRLHVPTPLGVELSVRRTETGILLVQGDTVIAEGRQANVQVEVPDPPTLSEAQAASREYRGFVSHWFPTCFVCGPKRGPGDGLRIFPGDVAGRRLVASTWEPDGSLCDASGRVLPEFMWAALDCPGAFTFDKAARSMILLGELAAVLHGFVSAGERCVVIGWEIAQEGRKHHTGTALFSESGACCGVGRAIFFEVPVSAGDRPSGMRP